MLIPRAFIIQWEGLEKVKEIKKQQGIAFQVEAKGKLLMIPSKTKSGERILNYRARHCM